MKIFFYNSSQNSTKDTNLTHIKLNHLKILDKFKLFWFKIISSTFFLQMILIKCRTVFIHSFSSSLILLLYFFRAAIANYC